MVEAFWGVRGGERRLRLREGGGIESSISVGTDSCFDISSVLILVLTSCWANRESEDRVVRLVSVVVAARIREVSWAIRDVLMMVYGLLLQEEL